MFVYLTPYNINGIFNLWLSDTLSAVYYSHIYIYHIITVL